MGTSQGVPNLEHQIFFKHNSSFHRDFCPCADKHRAELMHFNLKRLSDPVHRNRWGQRRIKASPMLCVGTKMATELFNFQTTRSHLCMPSADTGWVTWCRKRQNNQALSENNGHWSRRDVVRDIHIKDHPPGKLILYVLITFPFTQQWMRCKFFWIWGPTSVFLIEWVNGASHAPVSQLWVAFICQF